MVGTITIGTEIDTKGFEKDLVELEKDAEQIKMEAELKAKGIEIPTEEAQAIADELNRNLNLDLNTKSFDVAIAKAKTEMLMYQTMIQNANALELSDADVLDLANAYEKAKNKLIELQNQKQKAKGFNFKDIAKELKNIIKSMGKWALAIFGIRGAFNAVRSAMSIISQNDKQLASDLQFMKTALAYVLEPVIRAIVNLMKILVQYVAYVVKAWTGRDIFASAKKNLKAGEKSAKAINKSMAGFDEANTLSGGGSGGGGGTPGTSIEPLPDGEAPAWLKWIAENKDIILSALAGIALGILAVKLGLTGLLGGVIIGLITALVLLIIQNWDKIKAVLDEVWKWIKDNIIDPIVAGFEWLWKTLKSIFEPVIEFFASIFTTVWQNITTVWNNIVVVFTWVWNKIKEIFGPVVKWFQEKFETAREKIKSVFNPIVEFFSKIWNKVKTKLKEFGEKVGETVGGSFKAVVNGVLTAIEKILNFPIKTINKLIDTINEVPGINIKKLSTFNLPRLAKGGIVNMPGRGVPVGGALAGERGQEGVIPLTDEQQMQRIGEAIGRYVTINLTNIIRLNARQIAKETRKVNAETDFATNG